MKNALSSYLMLSSAVLVLSSCAGQTATDTQGQAQPQQSGNSPQSQGLLETGPTSSTLGTQAGQSSATKPVITTPSGLQYKELTAGNGPSPQAGQRVTVHYTGWLQSNGSKFDSSVDRGEPFTFTLGQGEVIKGWDEGVASMKVGGKRRLMIPPSLGYGEQGAGGAIPPNAELVFDVELLGVQ